MSRPVTAVVTSSASLLFAGASRLARHVNAWALSSPSLLLPAPSCSHSVQSKEASGVVATAPLIADEGKTQKVKGQGFYPHLVQRAFVSWMIRVTH